MAVPTAITFCVRTRFPAPRFEIIRRELLAKWVLFLSFDSNYSNQAQTSSFDGILARCRNLDRHRKRRFDSRSVELEMGLWVWLPFVMGHSWGTRINKARSDAALF